MPEHKLAHPQPHYSVWEFDTMEERDLFIAENFPSRKCTDSPGFFTLADGCTLQVFINTVTLYPKEGAAQ